MIKQNIFLFIFFGLSFLLYAQPPSSVTVQDDAKVGIIVTGEGNTLHTTQIFGKSPEYAELKKALTEIEAQIKTKAALCEKMKEDKLLESYINGCRSELIFLNNKQDSIAKIERKFREDVIRLAETFATIKINSERLRTAKALFDEGKIREADAVLKTREMETETDGLLLQKKRLEQNIEKNDSLLSVKASEWQIKAEITKTRYDLAEWFDSTNYYFLRSIQCKRGGGNQFAYAMFLQHHNQLDSALVYYQFAEKCYEELQDTMNGIFIQNNLGILYGAKNDYVKAEAAYLEALEIYKRLAQIDSATYEPDVAMTQNNLGVLCRAKNDYVKAEAVCMEALEIYKRLAQIDPAKYEPYLATTQNNLGNLYRDKNEYVKAKTAYLEALEIRNRLAQVNPASYDPDVAMTQNNLGALYHDKNDYVKAEAAYLEALKIYKRLAQVNLARYEPYVAGTQNNLGALYHDKNDYAKSEAACLEALEIYKRLAKVNSASYEPYVAMTQNNLGNLYRDKNEYVKAQTAYLEALAIRKRLAQIAPATYEPGVAMIQNNLGILYRAQNDYRKAEVAYLEALEIYRRFAALSPSFYDIKVARSAILLAFLKQKTAGAEEALLLFREALQIADKYPHIPLSKQISNDVINSIGIQKADPVLVDWYQKVVPLNQLVENETLEKEKVESQKSVVEIWMQAHQENPDNPRIHSYLSKAYGSLSRYLLFAGAFADAEAAAQRGLAIDPFGTWMITNLTSAMVFQGRYSEAEVYYKKLKGQAYDDQQTWEEVLLKDFETLEAAGITHPDVAKARAFLRE